MTLRISLVTHASTAATRTAAFGADEPVDPAGAQAARSAWFRWHPGSDLLRLGPTARCRTTAELLLAGQIPQIDGAEGPDRTREQSPQTGSRDRTPEQFPQTHGAEGPDRTREQSPQTGSPDRAPGAEDVVVAALDDCDYGRWRGRSLAAVAAADPGGVTAWLADPDAAPHGGETVSAVLARVAAWLDGLPADPAADGRRIVAMTHPTVVRAAVVHALGAPAAAFWRIDVAPLTRTDLTWTAATHPSGAAAPRRAPLLGKPGRAPLGEPSRAELEPAGRWTVRRTGERLPARPIQPSAQ